MDVPVHEDGAADDEVIHFTEVNDYFSIVCEVTYSMLSHDSFSLQARARLHVVERCQLSSAVSI